MKKGQTNIEPAEIPDYKWVEISGRVEHYARCGNLFNLPNKYAKIVSQNDEITLCDDGYHYQKSVGQRCEIVTKTIYGFSSQREFDDVLRKPVLSDCEDIRYYAEKVQSLQESYIATQQEEDREQIRKYGLVILHHVDEAVCINEMREIPCEIIDCVNKALKVLIEQYSNDDYVVRNIEVIKETIDEVEPLEFLRFNK